MRELTTGQRMSLNDNERVLSALPLPILRDFAYRAGLGQSLPLATYTLANELISDWVTVVLKHAVNLVEMAGSMTITYAEMRAALLGSGGDILNEKFAHVAAFKPVATFTWYGGQASTARELYDEATKHELFDDAGLLAEDDASLKDVVRDLAWKDNLYSDDFDEDNLSEAERQKYIDLVESMNDRARAACAKYAKYAAQVATHADNAEEGDAVDESEGDNLDLWTNQTHPRLDAATMEYNVDGGTETVRPSSVDVLTCGKIGDEGFSEQDHKERVQKLSIDESGLVCPVYVVRDIVEELLTDIRCGVLQTRDALTLFHHALECFGVSLFQKESAAVLANAPVAVTDKETSEVETLAFEVAMLKDEVAQLTQNLKQITARAKATQESLKAEATVALEHAAYAESALLAMQAKYEKLSADDLAVNTPAGSRSSTRRKQSVQTPNPALHTGNASESSAMTDASEAPVSGMATSIKRKRTSASNPAAEGGKRIQF